ncbi:MAG: Ig-like domain-containing protein, partial [Lachnospiraceae bacterium]|nr:Ig-like domain-containing protein [Lachnospiraceae bacterium]
PMQNTTLKLSPINFKNLEWSSLDGELDLVTEGSKSYYRNDYVKIDKAAGKIYAIGSGSCTLSFTDEFYNYLLPVTVVQPQEQRVYVNNDKTAKLKFYGVKNNAARYESSDNSIVTVDAKGKIKGIKPGVAVITCYYPSSSGDNSGFVYRARVFVENPALKETDYLKAGKNQYSYTININRSDDPDPVSINFRSDGNYRVYQPLVFKSNKPAVAFVNEFGFLEINGPGKATITTKVNGKKITIKVVVQ